MTMRNCLYLLLLVLLPGCATTSLTNLTPSTQIRNEKNLYPVSVVMDTTQATLRHDSIKPFVVIGLDFYPMHRTPLMKGRWEASIPVAADANVVNYRYKFDYQYNEFGGPKESSRLSAPYQLQITDK